MGSRVPASLSPIPLLPSDLPVAVNDPTDVDEERDSSTTDAVSLNTKETHASVS